MVRNALLATFALSCGMSAWLFLSDAGVLVADILVCDVGKVNQHSVRGFRFAMQRTW